MARISSETNKWIVFGHHFAAISGPGPLVGPVLAAQFGYLPGTLWILIGVVLGGAVQDFVILFCSMRRHGQVARPNGAGGAEHAGRHIGAVAILAIMIILLAVLALVVVKALAESPWGVFTVGATIPIAMFMGGYLRFWRVGKVLEGSALGVVLLLLAVWGGQFVHSASPRWRRVFTLQRRTPGLGIVIVYGLAASILPVWLLLAPRDYLSTFMKLGTIFALALGVFLVLARLEDARGEQVHRRLRAGRRREAVSVLLHHHCLRRHLRIPHAHRQRHDARKSSRAKRYARPIGYGAMCLESLVAIMAMIAACTLDPGVYLSMNIKGAGATMPPSHGYRRQSQRARLSCHRRRRWTNWPKELGEKTLFGRTGGAATLAVGMAQIFSKAVNGRWLDLWYHFAIMFEALFILTTLDAGTRVGRYLLQDVLGQYLEASRRNPEAYRPTCCASVLMVAAWGYFLIQGVRDPLGGINSLWPLFGIANQLLAAIALCLATTIILKMHLGSERAQGSRPVLALVTLVPLVWLLSVTLTAGVQKIFHSQPSIGFLAKAEALNRQLPALHEALATASNAGDVERMNLARKAVNKNRIERFNQLLDASVAGLFIVLVVFIVLLSMREWILLLARRRLPTLHETPPVWLPAYMQLEAKPLHLLSFLALLFALAENYPAKLSSSASRARP